MGWRWVMLAGKCQMCIFSPVCDQWCHVGSLKLTMMGVYTPHKWTFAICQGFHFPPEIWFTSMTLSTINLSFHLCIHSIPYLLSTSSVWHCKYLYHLHPSAPVWAWRDFPYLLGLNLGWKRRKSSPLRPFPSVFHCTWLFFLLYHWSHGSIKFSLQ